MGLSFIIERAPVPPVGLDPNLTYQDFTLSDGSRVLSRDSKTGTNWGSSLSLNTFTTGRRYFEVECVNYDSELWLGWADSVFAATDLTLAPGQSGVGNNTAWQSSGQRKFMNGSFDNNAGTEASTNDIVMTAIDLEMGMVWWGLNGTWFNYIGDPNGRPDLSIWPHRYFATSMTGTTFHAAISGEVGSIYRVKLASSDFEYTPPNSYYGIADTFPTPSVPSYNAMDPDTKSDAIRVLDGNETVTRGRTYGTVYYPSIVAKYGETSGKKYYEIKKTIGHGYFGISEKSTFDVDNHVGRGNSVGWDSLYLRVWNNSNWSSYAGTVPDDDDIIMVAFDTATGDTWWGLNGTWFSGDPATGTSPVKTVVSLIGSEVFPTVTCRDDSALEVRIRSSEWSYSAPSGFTEFAYGG